MTSSPSSPPPTSTTPTRTWRGMFKFIALGLSGFVVLEGSVIALVELFNVGPKPAFVVMITLVMAINFFVNRRYIFPAGRTGNPARQAIRFLVAAFAFRIIEYIGYSALLDHQIVSYEWAIIVVSAGSYLGKYYIFSAWVFK